MVAVTADAPPLGQQFADRTGDIQILANPSRPPTTATMPSTEVTIIAAYRQLPLGCRVGASFGAIAALVRLCQVLDDNRARWRFA